MYNAAVAAVNEEQVPAESNSEMRRAGAIRNNLRDEIPEVVADFRRDQLKVRSMVRGRAGAIECEAVAGHTP